MVRNVAWGKGNEIYDSVYGLLDSGRGWFKAPPIPGASRGAPYDTWYYTHPYTIADSVKGYEHYLPQIYDHTGRLQGSIANRPISKFAGNASPDTDNTVTTVANSNNTEYVPKGNDGYDPTVDDTIYSNNIYNGDPLRFVKEYHRNQDRLYNDGYNYKDGQRVEYLPEGARSFDYNFKFTPQIPDKPGQNLTNYMSNDAFKQYYELNKPFFDKADPNISMQEHYANWLRNKDYLPEAYKEQPGFFSQLGQGLMDNFTSNPLGFAGGLFNLYQGFKQAGYMKDYYNTQKDLYNTQKNIMLNNEKRNQEQWNMLKRQRASSSL